MPSVSRAFIKSGLVFLVLSLVMGWLVVAPGIAGLPTWWMAVETTVFHLFVVGWITQIIFGVALWFFPTWTRDRPRGPEWLSWVSFGCLNIGIALRGVGEVAVAAGASGGGWTGVLVVAALAQWLGALFFAVAIWPRVKGRKRRRSEGKS